MFSSTGATSRHVLSTEKLIEEAENEAGNKDLPHTNDKEAGNNEGLEKKVEETAKCDKNKENRDDKEEEKEKGEDKRERKRNMATGEKRTRNLSAAILAESFERISESTTAGIEALLKAKKVHILELSTSRAVKILTGKHYAQWAM